MNIVFLGAGAVFNYHSDQMVKYAPKDAKIYVVETNPIVAARCGYPILSYQEAVEQANLVFVLTPSYLRWEVCEPFIKKGTPLVIEKPLCLSWDEINLFEAAAKESWICPVVNARLVPKVEKWWQTLREEADSFYSWKIRYRPESYYKDTWHGKMATDGGVLAQQGFHCLDLVCWFGGMPKTIKCYGMNKIHFSPDMECEDTAHGEIAFENGKVGSFFCTTADSGEQEAGLSLKTKDKEYETVGWCFAGGTPGHTVLGQRVYECLENNLPPPVTVDSMIPSLRAMHAAYVSMDNRGAVVNYGEKHSKLGVYK
jgi:predicted dehydrogenase